LLKKVLSGFFINPKSSTLQQVLGAACSSKLLQTFVTPEERILERTEVMAERTEKDLARHNSGGEGRATAASLDDESSQSCNSNLLASALVIKT
jgi:hypothetical protein